ncbi:MAG: phosphoribosyltransferase family protein [Cyanobacteriota bacterium]
MSSAPLFSDRADAGEQLAQSLLNCINELNASGVHLSPTVYALPRGGIPIAVPVARQLDCPVDIVVAKKIATPQNPELAMGAVTSEGQVLWMRQQRFGKKKSRIRDLALYQAREKANAQLAQLSTGCPQTNPQGALALLIDDGIATGMTMAAATQALRTKNPAQIWICTPVAPASLMNWLSQWCDRVVALKTPEPFFSVSRFYQTFPQVPTEEALLTLKEHNHQFITAKPNTESLRGSQTSNTELS